MDNVFNEHHTKYLWNKIIGIERKGTKLLSSPKSTLLNKSNVSTKHFKRRNAVGTKNNFGCLPKLSKYFMLLWIFLIVLFWPADLLDEIFQFENHINYTSRTRNWKTSILCYSRVGFFLPFFFILDVFH